MKTATFLIIKAALIVASGVAFAGDVAGSSAPLKSLGEQIRPTPATHQSTASGMASSVVGNSKLKKTAQQHVAPLSLPRLKPTLPVNAGQHRGVAIIGGAAMKTPHGNGVINGTERRRSP